MAKYSGGMASMVITAAELHSTKPEFSFCKGSNPAHGVSESPQFHKNNSFSSSSN